MSSSQWGRVAQEQPRTMPEAAMRAYAKTGMKAVGGWLGRIDAEIIRCLMSYQSASAWRGGVAEIGVHHGKAFIMMCLGLEPGEEALCCDLFGDQSQNLDGSGQGDRRIFERNLRRFGVDPVRVHIREQSSLDLASAAVCAAVGPVRFFSVDGGHWLEIVKSDLAVAEASLAPHGIVALDDFHRPDWPDVSAGFFAWYAKRRRPLNPFLAGHNKLYLAEAPYADGYRAAIYADAFLGRYVAKVATFMGQEMPVMSEFLTADQGHLRGLMAMSRVYSPTIFSLAEPIRRYLRERRISSH